MLTLVVYDNLYAQADQNNNVLCVVRGYTINHETEKKDYFKLNHVYLNNSSTFIYRCPVNVTTIIESITLSNNTGLTATNVSIYLTTDDLENKLFSLTLPVNGNCVISTDGVKIYDVNGKITNLSNNTYFP